MDLISQDKKMSLARSSVPNETSQLEKEDVMKTASSPLPMPLNRDHSASSTNFGNVVNAANRVNHNMSFRTSAHIDNNKMNSSFMGNVSGSLSNRDKERSIRAKPTSWFTSLWFFSLNNASTMMKKTRTSRKSKAKKKSVIDENGSKNTRKGHEKKQSNSKNTRSLSPERAMKANDSKTPRFKRPESANVKKISLNGKKNLQADAEVIAEIRDLGAASDRAVKKISLIETEASDSRNTRSGTVNARNDDSKRQKLKSLFSTSFGSNFFKMPSIGFKTLKPRKSVKSIEEDEQTLLSDDPQSFVGIAALRDYEVGQSDFTQAFNAENDDKDKNKKGEKPPETDDEDESNTKLVRDDKKKKINLDAPGLVVMAPDNPLSLKV